MKWTLVKKAATAFVVLSFFADVACKRGASPQAETAAILESVRTYARDVKKISVEQLDITVQDVKVTGDKATCKALYSMKQHKEFPGFSKEYSLEKKDGKWAVVNTAPSGSSHGMPPDGEGSMPPGHPGSGAPGMMQGHTPTAGMGEMPPGHLVTSGTNAPGKSGGCPVAGAEDKPTPPAPPAKPAKPAK